MKRKVGLIIAIVLLLMILLTTLYLFTGNYKALPEAQEYLSSSDGIKINKIDEGYFFDGKGDETAIIFYPGAKVEYTAYSKLMYDLASEGYDCFLIEMPFNIAFFGQNKAQSIMDNYDYDEYYLAGHSLGGVVVNNYAVNRLDDINGIINLASYPVQKIQKEMPYLLVYGSNDLVINKERCEKAKENMSNGFREVIIEGGNHAGFALYDPQKNDGEASISSEEQEMRTVQEICDLIRQKRIKDKEQEVNDLIAKGTVINDEKINKEAIQAYEKFVKMEPYMNNNIGPIPNILSELKLMTDDEITQFISETGIYDTSTYIKSPVKYEDYKKEMLKYMTEGCFENNFSQYHNMDGYVGFCNCAGGFIPIGVKECSRVYLVDDTYLCEMKMVDEELYDHYLNPEEADTITEDDCYFNEYISFKYVNGELLTDDIIY